LFADAQKMLKKIIDEKWLTARAVIGFWPANSVDDDILIYGDKARKFPIQTLHTLRQQMARDAGRPNLALSDFIAPVGTTDYIGGFAVTAGIGEEPHIKAFQAAKDDYSAILLSALADRLAEAFAERLHEKVRKEYWGYAAGETLANDELIAEKYQGIRPAPGYPPAGAQREGNALQALGCGRQDRRQAHRKLCHVAGLVGLGLLLRPSESRYFGVGKIERDQVEDYARRKGWDVATAERWLAPLLNYNPRAASAA